MFDFIRKSSYFEWIDRFSSKRTGYTSATTSNLKDIQDHYALDRLADTSGRKILEIGGADCRVLRTLAEHNECWNADKFEGAGLGPKKVIETAGVRNALVYLGEFDNGLPDAYFDIVFSISVVEHVDTKALADFFNDIARVLRPGGRTFHAIDAYLFDPEGFSEPLAKYTKQRLDAYLSVATLTQGRLTPVESAAVSAEPRFRCDYASNSDREMYAWNRYAPTLKPMRSIAQSCSLRCEWERS